MKNILVTCPHCREVLEVDPSSATVVRHHPEVKPKPGGNFLGERMKSLEEEKTRRAAMVESSKEQEKAKLERHRDLFRKVQEQAKDDEGTDRPVREIDLD